MWCSDPAERNVLNVGLQKYQPGQSEPILVGGEKFLKPALRLMSDYRLRIDEVKGAEVVTSYTQWLESVQTRGAEDQEVFSDIQSAFRTHLSRIEETAQRCEPERSARQILPCIGTKWLCNFRRAK
jgi:hypothetical protein